MTARKDHFEQVLDDIEAGRRQADPATLIRADEAPGRGLDLVLAATGAATFDDAVRVATGRPHVGVRRGASPVLRARVPDEIKNGVRDLALQQGKPESEIVRLALAAYLEAERSRSHSA